MKKFEKELLFSQVEGETTTGSGNGTTGENAGEGENDAPEQEPVDEGAEDDNNMYDGQDGSSSGQTPNGERNPTSGTVLIDPIEVVGSPTDPAEDDNNMYDGQDGSSSGQTPNGESDPTSGTVLIDPVEVVGYPTDPADTPSDAEGPEEEEEDVCYGEDSDINDNSAPDNEYEYGDDGEGDGNTNDDDTQSSTEQSEEEKTENTTTEPTEEEIAAILSDFAEKFPNISFDSSLTVEQKIAFINAFLKLPPGLQNLGVTLTIKFDAALDAAGSYWNNVVTFRDVSSVAQATLEEFIHAYQDTIKSPEVMQATHAESEFEAKMLQILDNFAQLGSITETQLILGDPDKYTDEEYRSLYTQISNFAKACFSGKNGMDLEDEQYPWSFFDITVFLENFESILELWLDANTGYKNKRNESYDWGFWENLFNIFINQYD